MKVYYSIDEVPPIKNPVLTLGTFDGVHLGHQKVIRFLKESAEKIDGETVLFTFHPHPRMVLHPNDHGLEMIQSIDARIDKLASFGIDHLILFPFTKEFSRMTAVDFVREILVNKVNVKLMTIGYNHHFGRNRTGNLDLLKQLGETYEFDVQEIPAFQDEDINISSTKIRAAIQAGEIEKANKYLGSIFNFEGTVIEGDKIGTTLGYPTANINLKEPYLISPINGVYAVNVELRTGSFKGMMNIGTRPTISDTQEKRIEVHLFDFEDDLYGKSIRIFIVKRIRSEKSFDSLESLKSQLNNDKKTCLSVLDLPVNG
ncbi:bifunctional riboflavin kinase/FAD synthetase [Crocinitomix algicola]|uniref:bifunctional riboflavin kinase/FAD synthetase n=1 Tax=Crocinitomix algicola TaxID=1740263 RepID=UPI0008733FA3|nr:bifunctional riboflavin kinase/FAD synthetase [Crocinitomix algicola]